MHKSKFLNYLMFGLLYFTQGTVLAYFLSVNALYFNENGLSGLDLTIVQGDMRALSFFPDERFDLIFHPVSNVFVPDVLPVWREAYRVLQHGGSLLAGFMNPVEYIFDPELQKQGIYQAKYRLPYSDVTSITPEEHARIFGKEEALEFSHTLEEQIGGQIAAGFVITGFYESERAADPIAQFMPSYIATRALKG